ncbi:MAG: DUF3754 domain-containing protein, partial [Caulobacterales bacterium]
MTDQTEAETPEITRDAFIPARKAEIAAAIQAHGDLAPEIASRFPDLSRLIAAVMHYEAYDALENLKSSYAPLDPDAPAAKRETDASAFETFETQFLDALKHGNFVEIDAESAISAKANKDLTGLSIKCSSAGIRRIRFFARGARTQMIERKHWWGLRKEQIEAETFSEVIVVVAFKSLSEIDRADRRAFAKTRHGVRPAAALIKHFRNVARAELLSLHPGAKPTMRTSDQVMLAAPALIGGVPIAMQIVPAITVIFTVLALFFGARGAIENSELQRALAALSGLIAVGTFVMRQWMKYERQNLKYQKKLADTVYFRNMANNSGVLDALIGAGEDQNVKEVILAYWALLQAGKPITKAALDLDVETFLTTKLSLN